MIVEFLIVLTIIGCLWLLHFIGPFVGTLPTPIFLSICIEYFASIVSLLLFFHSKRFFFLRLSITAGALGTLIIYV